MCGDDMEDQTAGAVLGCNGDSPPFADGPGEKPLFDHVFDFSRNKLARGRGSAGGQLKIRTFLVDEVQGIGFKRDKVSDALFSFLQDVFRSVAVDDVLLEVHEGQSHFEHVLDEPAVLFQVLDPVHQFFRVEVRVAGHGS